MCKRGTGGQKPGSTGAGRLWVPAPDVISR